MKNPISRAEIEALVALQQMDREIGRGERELRAARAKLAALEDPVRSLESELERVTEELSTGRRELRDSERAVEDKKAAMERVKAKMSGVQNQRQYSAATVEYDLVRRDLRMVEDRTLELWQKIEELEDRKGEIAQKLELSRAEVVPRRAEVQAEQERVEELLAVHSQRRDEAAREIPAPVLELYDRIRASRNDVAMAPLTPDGACGHCYTSVTIQHRLEVRSLSKLVRCEGCGVILYPESV